MAFSRWLSSAKRFSNGLNPSRQVMIAKIQQNPYYRFQSIQEIEIAGELGIKIDVNKASVDDWLRLPDISINQARNLVEIRNAGIPLLCLEDLASALGVSVFSIEYWQPILVFAHYEADSFHAPAKIHLNSASASQLQVIPNLDASLAEKIISDRNTNGNFRNLADLQKRLNLHTDFAYHLMSYLQF